MYGYCADLESGGMNTQSVFDLGEALLMELTNIRFGQEVCEIKMTRRGPDMTKGFSPTGAHWTQPRGYYHKAGRVSPLKYGHFGLIAFISAFGLLCSTKEPRYSILDQADSLPWNSSPWKCTIRSGEDT